MTDWKTSSNYNRTGALISPLLNRKTDNRIMKVARYPTFVASNPTFVARRATFTAICIFIRPVKTQTNGRATGKKQDARNDLLIHQNGNAKPHRGDFAFRSFII